MRKFLPLFGLLLLLSSCATLTMADLKPYNKNRELLPALEPRVDINSFETAYSLGYSKSTTTGYATTTETVNTSKNTTYKIGEVIGSAETDNIANKDPRVQDAITLFDREVKNNICNPYGDVSGYIVCKIAASKVRRSGYGWTALSVVTLFAPNLLGMPYGTYKTAFDVEVEIYGLKNNLIGRYNAQAYDKTWIALYYGYSTMGPSEVATPAARISGINAFKEAMNDIKGQIENDYNRLNRELTK